MLIAWILPVMMAAAAVAQAQTPGAAPGPSAGSPAPFQLIASPTQPSLSPGVLLLLGLEDRFAKSVDAGGGKAFATWFADDAVVLNNGKPAILGRGAIAQSATWDAKQYTLNWVVSGAQMGSSSDMGFTWGIYQGVSRGADGKPIATFGRYITIWKKLADGSWKVAMDASADSEPGPTECCSLPKP